MVKICEVVDGCEDCPKYGDDCDGDKMAEHTDYIRRADAIECCQCHGSLDCINRIKALPSADAEPTVIRSRTLMPTKDFKEWAKRIREENPNAIIIPCDAEVVSADAVSREECNCLFSKPKIKLPKKAVEFNFSNIEVVVRCKDCKYYNNDYMGEWCGRHQAPVWVKENDFCSWGKMKGGDDE